MVLAFRILLCVAWRQMLVAEVVYMISIKTRVKSDEHTFKMGIKIKY